MIDNKSIQNNNVEEMLRKLNSGWERLFPDNPEIENVFMNR